MTDFYGAVLKWLKEQREIKNKWEPEPLEITSVDIDYSRWSCSEGTCDYDGMIINVQYNSIDGESCDWDYRDGISEFLKEVTAIEDFTKLCY